MRTSLERNAATKRAIAYSGAAMFAGAALIVAIESLTPGGPDLYLYRGSGAFAIALFLFIFGRRLPYLALASLCPIGVVLIAYSLSKTGGLGDGALLYMWPVLAASYFYGWRGSVLIVTWVAIVHAIALSSMAPDIGYFDRWLVVTMSVGVVAATIGILIQRNEELLTRLGTEARVDALTGLLNRRGFEEQMKIVFDRAQRENTPVAAISFDIDRFKQINDEWGHEIGDEVLARAGQTLRDQTRSIDIVARVGGDELIALLPNSGLEMAEACAERICSSFSRTTAPDTPAATMSAGVTVEVAPDDEDKLLRSVDAALYRAKVAGRDQTVTVSPQAVA